MGKGERLGFTIEGGYIDHPRCNFCTRRYEEPGIQICFRDGYEICPRCLLKGPARVVQETLSAKRPPAYIKKYVAKIAGLSSFRELAGGILAVKIAEAWAEGGRGTEIGPTIHPWKEREKLGLAGRARPQRNGKAA
jgi:hypothetical protein